MLAVSVSPTCAVPLIVGAPVAGLLAADSDDGTLKTQGRACLIERTFSLVILNSISMAKSSPDLMPYSSSNSSWIASR